jgi:hypothetical protein
MKQCWTSHIPLLTRTAFGIQPIQLAGGTVKVKDEVRTEFELFLK